MIHFENDNVTLHLGDALKVAAELEPRSVRTIVTSPPYFGLRDYGHQDQLGAESSVDEYVANLATLFAALRSTLADDGTLWLNLGDSYGGLRGNKSPAPDNKHAHAAADTPARGKLGTHRKHLLGIPWRVAFALQADGWILRSDIIWAKPNPMPESVRDRPTKAHEYLFLFAKSPRYFYDAEAIKEADGGKASGNGFVREERVSYAGRGVRESWQPGKGRNKRTVWTVTPKPFKEAHFATYPPELIRPCILAGSEPGDTVLDPFSGSGTTGMVALEEGRRYVGIDVNVDYLDLSLSTRFKDQASSTEGHSPVSKKKDSKKAHLKALYRRSDEIDRELDKDPKPNKRARLVAEQGDVMTEIAQLEKKKSPVIDGIEPWAATPPKTSSDDWPGDPALIEEVLEQAGKAVGEALGRAIDEAFERPIDHAALDPESGKRHLAHLKRVGELTTERATLAFAAEDLDTKKKARKAAQARIVEIDAELATLRKATEARTLEVAHETTGRNLKTLAEKETDEEIKARVLAKRAARQVQAPLGDMTEEEKAVTFPERRPEGGQTEQEAGVIHAEDEPVTVKKKGKKLAALVEQVEETVAELAKVTDIPPSLLEVPEGTSSAEAFAKTLVDPEAVQPRDRWGRPEIVRPDGTTKGYRRMTTFIDVIDDKDNLVKWKGRVILAGVAATEQKIAGDGDLLTIDEVGTESIIERVEAANQSLEADIKGAKKDHKKGKIDDVVLQVHLDGIEKAHRHALTDLAEEAFQAGDGYLKAETGTRIHKLTEFVDRGEELPEDTTDSERRDIAAYVAARDALGVEVKLIEQFVVLDELEVGGTLDRLIRIDSPSLGRRVTAIGDVKTGRMDFGAGKMARQLAGYAKGKTYDWRDPEHVRKPLRANQQVGYIFNVPAGQGVCFVYELDLTLGARGLKLCKEIFDYRAETSTLKKVGTLIHSTKDVTPPPRLA